MKPYWTFDTINLKYASAETVFEKIQRAFLKYGKEHVEFDVGVEHCYGDEIAYCNLLCSREMTLEEKTERQLKEKAQVEKTKAYKLAQYEQLKKEFGK